jgi:hypothetical protein
MDPNTIRMKEKLEFLCFEKEPLSLNTHIGSDFQICYREDLSPKNNFLGR